jgi:hypothetical protein
LESTCLLLRGLSCLFYNSFLTIFATVWLNPPTRPMLPAALEAFL